MGDDVPFLPMNAVDEFGRTRYSRVAPTSKGSPPLTRFRLGDVLVAKITPCFENGKGCCVMEMPTEIGLASTEFHVLRPTAHVDSQYLWRLTTLPEFRRAGVSSMTGSAGQQRVSAKFVANYVVRLPTRREQDVIARIVDELDGRLLGVVNEKIRLADLMEEQRRTIMWRAVTRGLNAGVQLRASGVPWLGEIPRHWTVVALKRLCRRSALYGANVPASRYESSGVRLIRTTDITSAGALREQGVQVAPEEMGEWLLADGDILVSRSGTVGRSFLYDSRLHPPAAYAGYLVRFVPSHRVEASYLSYFTKTRAFLDYLRTQVIASTIENVNAQKYARCPVPLPPLGEQREIAEYLMGATAELDAAVTGVRQEIELLKEYRARLIADVVTGRLGVREAADRLPNEEGA